jgi:hypothetical protein
MITKSVMARKEVSENIWKIKSMNKFVMQKWEEILKWRTNNASQKRFFSLEDNEQKLLEKTYIVFSQVCPELTREDYLDHLRKSDRYDKATKAVLKKLLWDF